MARRGIRWWRVLAVLPAIALAVAGCSLESGDVGIGSVNGRGSIGRDFHFSGRTFAVGSKEFTENVILGRITIDALRAAGATVQDHTKLSGTAVVRDALVSGDIDMYWDYAGTGWELFLKHDQPVKGATGQFDRTAAEDLARNRVRWLGPAKFGDSYGIAVRSHAPGDLGRVSTYSGLAAFVRQHPDQATFCGASEFFDRQFGTFEQLYGVKFPANQVHTNDLSLDYTNAARGRPCNFAEVFTTDARISTKHLKVLDDDKGAFYTQLASLTVRKEVVDRNPKLADLVQRLGAKLDLNTMMRLNKMVDIEGRTPEEAARSFLKDNGFIA